GAAAEVRRARPDVQPAIAAGSAIPPALLARAGLPSTPHSWDLLHHAGAAIVKSGTSTLQAALALTPMVVTYRMHPLTFAIARRVVRVDHVALANLVAGERVVPELIQDEATPQTLAEAVLPLLDEGSEARARVCAGLSEVRRALQGDGEPAERVADLVAELLEERAR